MKLAVLTTILPIYLCNPYLVPISEDMKSEITQFLENLDDSFFKNVSCIENIMVSYNAFPQTISRLQELKKDRLNNPPYFYVLDTIEELDFPRRLALIWIYSKLYGETLEQNTQGSHLYQVHDRGLKMESGGRYSQTNQGGNFHTDGVNVEVGYDIFLLGSATPPREGGESVIVDGDTVVGVLNGTALGRDTISHLQQPFWWEWKGVRIGEYYQAPILKNVDGNYQWKYMRPYLEESGRNTGGIPLEQLEAMEELDGVLNDPTVHTNFLLQPGQVAVLSDRKVFHGRTSFVDHANAMSLDEFLENRTAGPSVVKRTMLRTWVNY